MKYSSLPINYGKWNFVESFIAGWKKHVLLLYQLLTHHMHSSTFHCVIDEKFRHVICGKAFHPWCNLKWETSDKYLEKKKKKRNKTNRILCVKTIVSLQQVGHFWYHQRLFFRHLRLNALELWKEIVLDQNLSLDLERIKSEIEFFQTKSLF